MRSLISQCQNSALCCFGENIARPFAKWEDKVKVVKFNKRIVLTFTKGKGKYKGKRAGAHFMRPCFKQILFPYNI